VPGNCPICTQTVFTDADRPWPDAYVAVPELAQYVRDRAGQLHHLSCVFARGQVFTTDDGTVYYDFPANPSRGQGRA
jgi:hypothetical protein